MSSFSLHRRAQRSALRNTVAAVLTDGSSECGDVCLLNTFQLLCHLCLWQSDESAPPFLFPLVFFGIVLVMCSVVAPSSARRREGFSPSLFSCLRPVLLFPVFATRAAQVTGAAADATNQPTAEVIKCHHRRRTFYLRMAIPCHCRPRGILPFPPWAAAVKHPMSRHPGSDVSPSSRCAACLYGRQDHLSGCCDPQAGPDKLTQARGCGVSLLVCGLAARAITTPGYSSRNASKLLLLSSAKGKQKKGRKDMTPSGGMNPRSGTSWALFASRTFRESSSMGGTRSAPPLLSALVSSRQTSVMAHTPPPSPPPWKKRSRSHRCCCTGLHCQTGIHAP